MTKIKLIQYAIAATVGLLAFSAQVLVAYRSLGADFMHRRGQLMQQQLLERITDDLPAAMVVLSYFAAAATAHIALTTLSLATFRTFALRFAPHYSQRLLPGILFVLFTLLMASIWNHLLFPMSRAFQTTELLMIQTASPILVWGGSIVIIGVTLAAVGIWLWHHPKLATCMAIAAAALGLMALIPGSPQQAEGKQPNVIILGIDSLRPDFLPAYGFGTPGLTPNINNLMNEMVVFEDATTPLARTFVAYTSLLKGENPVRHGVRFNLYPRTEFNPSNNLATRLRDAGYYTVFAMDESRFANFDSIFGFDELITPPTGALDFLIGGSYDFLATNLLLKVPVINRAFPHVHGNRAAYRTYDVNAHPFRVTRALRNAPTNKPLFIISHLCLPHWPYERSSLFKRDEDLDFSKLKGYEDAPLPYARSLRSVDSQFAKILNQLRDSGYLQNALVVVISDHGESFPIKRDQFHHLTTGEQNRTFFGHGGFALSDSQFRVVLGFQRYRSGQPIWDPRLVSGDVSLIDVAPTVVDEVIGSEDYPAYEGISLLPVLSGKLDHPIHRFRFIETGIRSTGVETSHINENEVAMEMSYLYRIEPDLRFEIRPDLLASKIKEKQRGVIRGTIGIAAVPGNENSSVGQHCWLLADFQERTLRCVDFPSSDPLVSEMQGEVCRHFENDPGFKRDWCGRTETVETALSPVTSTAGLKETLNNSPDVGDNSATR